MGYDFISQQMDNEVDNQFGFKNFFNPTFKPVPARPPVRPSNYNSNYNNNYNYNYDYKNDFNYNFNYRNMRPYKQISFRNKPDYYGNQPEYYGYQIIEQKMPIQKMQQDVQFQLDDELTRNKMPNFIDSKSIDKQVKKLKEKQERINQKQKKLINLRKYDEIRELDQLRFQLQTLKVQVQEQIEELRNLEFRCRRKRLYFFDTLWLNTARTLKAVELDIDDQLYRIDKLLKEFSSVYNEVEKRNRPKVDGESESMLFSSSRQPALSKEAIEGRLREPRKSFDQLQKHSNKLISTNSPRLDKIKIILKDFKLEFKDKL